MMTTNKQLHKLVEKHGLTVEQLMELTGRCRTHVYGWLASPSAKHYKVMRESDLRLVQLELGIAVPAIESGVI